MPRRSDPPGAQERRHGPGNFFERPNREFPFGLVREVAPVEAHHTAGVAAKCRMENELKEPFS